jgi:hypothetical protein
VALTAGLQFSATTANAVLLATEPLDYLEASGTALTGLNGGSGWLEAYPSTSVILTNGLSYPGAYTVGQAMRFGASMNLSSGRDWGTDATVPLPDGSVYYYSVLVLPELNGRGTFIPFKSTGSGDGQNGFGIRIDNNGGNPQFKAWSASQAAGNNLDFAGGYGSTYLVIGKVSINQSGDSTNTIWVYQDPTAIPTSEPTAGGSTVTSAWSGNAETLRTTLSGRAFSNNTGLNYDQIRIGTTFADVIPPSGPEPSLAISPAAAVENQQLTATWSDIPGTASAIVLNPGNLDLLPFTSGGAGQTFLQAPGVDTEYVLTYTVGGVPTSITNQFTAIAPFFALSPTNGWENDTLNFTWRVPVGSSPVIIDPGAFGFPNYDATGETSFTDGTGSTSWLAPASNTTYVLSYTYNSTTLSLTQQFTVADPFLAVPSPAIENGTLAITWRVDDPLGVTGVALEYGPAGGPFTTVDVTANTDFVLGTGSYNLLTASLVNTNFNLRWTNGKGSFVLSTNITVLPEIFTNLVAINNTNSIQINGAPMEDGVLAYTDRGHVWAAVPSILRGAQFVKFAQQEKFTTNLVVSFNSAKDATFFLLLDNRIGDNVGGNNPVAGTDDPPTLPNANNTMAWVLNTGFQDSGVDIGLDENPVPGTNTIDQSYSVYFRQVSAGESFTFFEQNDTTVGGPGGRNMYGVAGVAPQVTPIAFVALPAEITVGESSTLSWTVQPGSIVSIDNGIGDVTALTDPTFGTGSTNITPALGTNSYTLTYDPPGAATPPVDLGPVTIVVNAPLIPTDPTNLTFAVTNGQISLSWPAEYLGWSLQKQTNALNVGLSTNWETVVGTDSVTSTNFPVDEAEATFFRMLLLQP